MLDIVKEVELAVQHLRTLKELPKEGILAGGAIANILWGKVSNTDPVINDIDIFHFDIISDLKNAPMKEMKKRGFRIWTRNHEEKTPELDGYDDLIYKNVFDKYLIISRCEREGLINNVYLETNTTEPSIVIESFDLTCTQVSYDLSTGQVYYTKEFENFLNTGTIRVCNSHTPAHTAIRLVKKLDDLKSTNCNLDREFTYLSYSFDVSVLGVSKRCLGEGKYLEYSKKYKDTLKKYFHLHKEICKKDNETFVYFKFIPLFCKENIGHIPNIDVLKYYIYNIYDKDERTKKLWNKLGMFWSGNNEYLKNVDIYNDTRIDSFFKLLDYKNSFRASLADLNLYKQLEIVSDITPIIKEQPKLLNAFLSNTARLTYNTIEELKQFITMLSIKYRKTFNENEGFLF